MERVATLGNHLTGASGSISGPKAPLRVAVTGAAGQIAYSLLLGIGKGLMLGSDQPVILQLLEVPPAENALKGVVMELEDCALPLLEKIIATVKPEEAFAGADVAIFVGAFPRKAGMERKDLLEKNAEIFHHQGALLAKHASPNVKVLVVGNPANTNCLLLKNAAGSKIPAKNFSCLTRLDHNRAKAQLALKLNVPVKDVRNVIIWGNHSATQYPYLGLSEVHNYPASGITSNGLVATNDETWVRKQFIPTVQKRGAAIIEARKLSSAASAAYAIIEHVRDWVLGTAPGEIVSMGVTSDGSYGIPEGLIFSYPVVCSNGDYTIIQGVAFDEFSKQQIAATTQELIEERDTAIAFVNSKRS